MWHVALGLWHWVRQVAAPCNVAGGSGMTCHWIPPNVVYWNSTPGFDFNQSPQSTCHSAPVSEIWSKLNHPRQKKMTSCRFSRKQISAIVNRAIVNRHHSSKLLSFPENPLFTFWQQDPRWQISAILDFRDPIMSPLKSSWAIDTIALNCLVFEKIAFLHVGIKMQNGGSPPYWIFWIP